MVKKIIAALIIVALFFSVAGVMAEDSGGSSGSSDSGGSSDSSSGSDSSGSSDSSSGSSDSSSSSDHSVSHDSKSGSGSSGTSDSSSSSDHSVSHDVTSGSDSSKSTDSTTTSDRSTGTDTSSGTSTSPATGSSSGSGNELETAIEHSISALSARESEMRSSGSATDPPTDTRVAAASLASLTTVPGTTAPQLAPMATTIENSLSDLSASEKAITSRSGVTSFLFGGDDAAATKIEAGVNEDLAMLNKMDQILASPSTSPALRTFTQQREDVIRAELLRLQGIAASEKQKKGLFG
jgi:hypothetical protein